MLNPSTEESHIDGYKWWNLFGWTEFTFSTYYSSQNRCAIGLWNLKDWSSWITLGREKNIFLVFHHFIKFCYLRFENKEISYLIGMYHYSIISITLKLGSNYPGLTWLSKTKKMVDILVHLQFLLHISIQWPLTTVKMSK